jgi:putative endonuclease
MARHNDLGKKGEDIAVAHLIGKGHNILARNFRYGKAEVDIISSHSGTVVFTEVKTRSTDSYGYPEEAVKGKKKEKLRAAMDFYIEENNIKEEPRFDIISITISDTDNAIYHIEDAFYH